MLDEDTLMDDGGDNKGGNVSGFISKIYKMVSDPTTQDIVAWNATGDGFVVKNEFLFASQIMRSYFRHQNFSSFVRQLNFYGFHSQQRSADRRARACRRLEHARFKSWTDLSLVLAPLLLVIPERSTASSVTAFYHPSFRKGHPELLGQIQRKTHETSHQTSPSHVLSEEWAGWASELVAHVLSFLLSSLCVQRTPPACATW